MTPLALTKSDLLVTTALKTVRKYVHVVWNRRTDTDDPSYSAYPTGPATITLEPLQVPRAEQPSPIDPVSGRRFLVHTEPLAQNIPITVPNSYRGAWERMEWESLTFRDCPICQSEALTSFTSVTNPHTHTTTTSAHSHDPLSDGLSAFSGVNLLDNGARCDEHGSSTKS